MNITRYLLLVVVYFLFVRCGLQSNYNDELPHEIRKIENLTIYSSDAESEYSIKLAEKETFGDTENIFFKSISSFAVDEEGRVYIPQDSIHVFRPDGSYLTSVGSKGKGPGEFQNIAGLRAGKESLYVFDAMLRRLSEFSIDSFAHHNTFDANTEDKTSRGELFLTGSGEALLTFEDLPQPDVERYKYLYPVKEREIDYSNELIKKQIKEVFSVETDARSVQGVFPFNRTTLITVSGDGSIYTAWTEYFLIRKYNSDGNYLHGFYYPHDQVPFDRNDYFGSDRISQELKKLDTPDTWPVLQNMIADSAGRLWISTITKEDQIYQWWVLNDDGTLLAKFEWPRDKSIEEVKNGYMYTRETDEMGVENIVKYEIQMEKE